MSECIHGLDEAWCATCLHGPARRDQPPTIEATFRARYEGQCSGCDLPINPGQTIHKLSNDRYVHEGCQP